MLQRYFPVVAALLAIGSCAMAQITIDYTNVQTFQAVGVSVKNDTTPKPTSIIIGNATDAAAQVFDFSSLVFSNSSTRVYIAPSTTPYAAHFPSATISYADNNSFFGPGYSYFQLSPQALDYLGFEGSQKVGQNIRYAALPMTIGTTWESHSRSDTISFNGASGRIKNDVSATCDAFGSLKTSRGTFPCLRLKFVQVQSYIPPLIPPTKTISYQFFTKTGENISVVLADTLEENHSSVKPQTVSYAHPAGAPAAVAEEAAPTAVSMVNAYPNPAQNQSMLSYYLDAKNTVTAELVNMLGARVATLASGSQQPGMHQAPIDVTNLSGGMYLCKLVVNGHTTAYPIVVMK